MSATCFKEVRAGGNRRLGKLWNSPKTAEHPTGHMVAADGFMIGYEKKHHHSRAKQQQHVASYKEFVLHLTEYRSKYFANHCIVFFCCIYF